jgi:hypothetical protein
MVKISIYMAMLSKWKIIDYFVQQGIFALDLNWPFLVFFSGLFGLFLVPFTVFHTNQILQNRTTIESYERSNFIMGHRRNRDVLSSRYFNAWNLGKM